MRSLNICILTLFYSYTVLAGSEINIVINGNFQGLADPTGEILIPAVYDGIGWSDGTISLEGDLIGYLDGDKWGLINTKNKKVTSPLYAALLPLGEDLFIASKKARLTNHLYHGVIDKKGEILVDFKYFSVSQLTPGSIKVGSYENGNVLYGVRNLDDEEVIPIAYQSVSFLNNLIVCQGDDNLTRIFNLNGQAIYSGWLDKIVSHPKGFEITEEGKKGLISLDHQIIKSPGSKELMDNGEIRDFKKWEIKALDGDTTFYKDCDSITILNDHLWVAHVNDAQHMLGAHEKLFSNQKYLLKYIQRGFIVAQNKHSGKWGLYKTDGRVVEEGFDYIRVDSNYFYCQRMKGWDIYNSFSRKINSRPFESIGVAINGNVSVKQHGYWGWIDFTGNPLVSFKYDDLVPGIGNQYVAKYANKWGIANLPESWAVMPEFDSVIVDQAFYLAKKGMGTYIFDPNGALVYRTGSEVIRQGDMVILKGEEGLGFVTDLGSIVYPTYQEVKKVGEFYVCRKDSVLEMINPYGRKVLTEVDEVQEVFGYSEGFFHILKNGKHGFVDENGKLRVANRYDGALPYHEGLAAIKLRGGWGYINKWEQLVIQPHYDTCAVFESGLANVAIQGKYGIMDMEGNMIINPDYANIRRTSFGNYVMTDEKGKQGLANEQGRILLRPNYDEVIDTAHDFVIARIDNGYGVITYQGYSYLPFNYQQVEVQGDYLLLVEK